MTAWLTSIADPTETPKFRVQLIDDVTGVSLCGALKNVVAVAAGLSDGLGYGDNTKCKLPLSPKANAKRRSCASASSRRRTSAWSSSTTSSPRPS